MKIECGSFDAALRERTAPFVFWNSLKPSPSSAAPEVYRRFENAYLSSLARNVAIFEELKDILESFHREGIRTAIFKGVFLARYVYPDPGLRPMTDLDLLVASHDIARADALLLRLGYRRPFGATTLAAVHLNPYNNSILYDPPENRRAFVHLHWHLVNFQPHRPDVIGTFDIARIWREAREVSFGDVEVKALKPSHHLMYSCLHAFKHAFHPFLSMVDIAMILQKEPALRPEDLAREARETGLALYVFHAMTVLKTSGLLKDEGFCDEIIRILMPRKISVWERRFTAAALRRGSSTGLGWALFGMNRGWRDRSAFVYRSLFPPRRAMAFIRQKNIERVGWRDYASRLLTGIS